LPEGGDLGPDVELTNVATGKPVRLSSLRGKLVLLEFWATWCGPCQPAMAKLNTLHAEQAAAWKDRVVVVPVSLDLSADGVRAHVHRRGWTHLDHFWAGPAEYDAPAARAFGIDGVPDAVLIGRDGRVLWRGHPSSEEGGQNLKSRIEAELK
jgi:cytochrome oxidase Cu insertion factor (SCO1/SenC/PrrC family)